jgi:hypothetical protein
VTNDCEHRESIGLLVDGELSDDAANAVRGHLVECAECARYHLDLADLIEQLKPQTPPGLTVEEARFWRRFEADLALRVARGVTPFWKRPIVIPFPVAVTSFVFLITITAVALHTRDQVSQMHRQTARLQTALKDLQERSFFANASAPAPAFDRDAVAKVSDPVAAATPQPVMRAARPLPTPENLKIRFIDSEVAQPGDLY